MNKKEVVEVLKTVESYFPGKLRTDDPGAMVNTWYRVLKDYDYDTIIANLDSYAKHNHFVPAVADLVKAQKVEVQRYVPTTEETMAILQEQERVREEVANDPHVQDAREKAKSEIQKILGIKRG